MALRQLPDAETLRKLLRYEPDTGRLFWRPREPGTMSSNPLFSDQKAADTWNKRFAGKPALCSKWASGYLRGTLLSKNCYAHRVIWKMVTGEDAPNIDHINGDKCDNRFCNLRSVTKAENARNAKLYSPNRSGCPGVKPAPKGGRWEARIKKDGVTYVLGTFGTKEQAILARKKAERELGFHPNHGRTV